jgi:hypothetical protein
MSLLPNVSEVTGLASVLAPGLIILGIRNRVIGGALPDYKDRLIAYALVSAAYFAGIAPLFHINWGLKLPTYLWGGLQYLLLPVALGIVAAYVYQYELAYRIARWAGLEFAHPVPAAWDFTFARMPAGTFVLVTVGDGSQVAGRMGKLSFASSSREERDLLLEEVWQAAEQGAWERLEPSRSILICSHDIRYVEIF